ncbi:aminoglycoside phosphotransferase family protein [Paractinoplanes rishiriensis]|uniref:Aminoglycoside phosphotransferase domain-containing protein n=1 Tax=Paractinoplanes rishiriensis TaxID=1050105 RepID=A0A919N0J7_9ACTN|nr:aminoglycoside phosphotransferase family protein [Actinoplanes rishiriensis]GIE99710.1 hypothetical protein Ari01nite_71750 [Actinoplanes rishiriensis]
MSAEPKLLGQGMEGAVYEIDESWVRKVWFAGSVPALRRTAAFYEALAAKALSFAVPHIAEISVVGGQVVTVERRLPGSTLPADAPLDVVVGILAELAAVGELAPARELAVLGGETPLHHPGEAFPVALARVAADRLEQFRPVLNDAVGNLEAKAAALLERLPEVDTGRRSVVHGDLFPANVLVGAAGRPSAVLDWGFLTTEGDPAFDAAVTAAIFDMYGPEALATERRLLARMSERFGYAPRTLLVYRAAYSLITANAYSADGKDGHFAWCVTALNRDDVTRALLG